MSSEDKVRDEILEDLGLEPGLRLFPNPVGKFWAGKAIDETTLGVTLLHPRRVDAGLCVGSSDLIGWQTIYQVDGRAIARFVALELKNERGRPSKEQLTFISNVIKAGGVAGVVRNAEDARKILGIQR